MRVRTRNEELSGRFFLLERVDPERARPKKKYSYGPLPLADGSLSCLNKTPKTHTRIHNKKGRVKRESSCCCGGGGLVLSQIKPYFDDVFRFSSVSREYVLRTERERSERRRSTMSKMNPLTVRVKMYRGITNHRTTVRSSRKRSPCLSSVSTSESRRKRT